MPALCMCKCRSAESMDTEFREGVINKESACATLTELGRDFETKGTTYSVVNEGHYKTACTCSRDGALAAS